MEGAYGYLAQLAETHASSIEDYRERAYAIYILTRSGQVTTNSLTALKERLEKFKVKDWQKDITALYMAVTYRLLQLDKQASDLRKSVSFDAAVTPNYSAFFDKLSYQAMYLYLISKHFPEELKQFSNDSLLTLAFILGAPCWALFKSR